MTYRISARSPSTSAVSVQAKISRVEGADAVPTLPLLLRLARALDASLNIALGEDQEEVRFVARPAA